MRDASSLTGALDNSHLSRLEGFQQVRGGRDGPKGSMRPGRGHTRRAVREPGRSQGAKTHPSAGTSLGKDWAPRPSSPEGSVNSSAGLGVRTRCRTEARDRDPRRAVALPAVSPPGLSRLALALSAS